jgi:hypothetical protein
MAQISLKRRVCHRLRSEEFDPMPTAQNFKNHSRIVPMYHIGVFFPLLANFIWALYRFRYGLTGDAVINLAVSIALLLMFVSVRTQILTVQDRLIRLEMRQRLREVLPADLFAQAAAMPVKLIVALRFASDAELPALVREVTSGSLATGKDIKMRIRDWQPDYLRA